MTRTMCISYCPIYFVMNYYYFGILRSWYIKKSLLTITFFIKGTPANLFPHLSPRTLTKSIGYK
jgi:hypothetical protein